MSIEDHFPNAFTVKTFVDVDEYGDADPRPDGDTGFCRLDPAKGKVVQDDDGKEVLADAVVYLLAEVTIEERDLIDVDGVLYRVLDLRRQRASLDSHHIKLMLRVA